MENSIKEDIKNIEEIINLINKELDKKAKNVSAILDLEDLLSLRNLIKAYKELEEFKKQVTEIENTNFIKYKNYIPVSLVKEKIEELKKLITEAQKELGSVSKEYTIYVYQKDILQELLEKRK